MTAARVLSVIHAPHLGGPQRRNLALAQEFAASGAAHLTVVLPEGPGAHALRAAGVDVRAVPLGRLRARPDLRVQLATLAGWPGDVGRISALIRETRADVVLLNGLANPQAALAARRTGAALVWQLLDTRTPPALARLLRPCVRAWADSVMATGTTLAKQQLGVDPTGETGPLQGRVVSFAPPVDAAHFCPDPAQRAAARAELGVTGRPVVGMIANLTPQKGHDAFLDAAAALRRTRPDVAFVWLGARFAGQTAYADRLARRAHALGLGDLVVQAPGARVHLLAQAFDVAWLTSPARSEGIPTAAGEAMALARPLAGFRVGALTELVPRDQHALLHPPGDTAGLAATTARLLADPAARAAIGAAARRAAQRVCDPGQCAVAHLQAFEIALAHRFARPVRWTSQSQLPVGDCLEGFNQMPENYAERAGRSDVQDGRGRDRKTRPHAEAKERA
mgnify:CR=1 FL=1